MSLNTKVIMSFLAGMFSAILAWIAIDFNGVWRLAEGESSGRFLSLFAHQAPMGIIFGIFVGVAIGVVNGMSGGSGKLIQRYAAYGVLVGAVGGLLGLFFGQLLFGSLYRDPRESMTLSALGPLIFIWDVIVRALGWSIIGFFLGLVQGLPISSKKAAWHGAIGGLIGGFLGGTLFEIIPYILPPGTKNPSVVSRGISMIVTGASIGFFIGLVEALLKQAWIRVVQGRNEGKEYIISKPRTTIGRDELSDVGLFGDRNVSPLHAVIDMSGGRHALRDAGGGIGTLVNGQKVAEHALRDGDLIEIGSIRLEFHEKATASKIPQPVDAPKQAVQIPTMQGQCPFCGTKKDPITGACACTVGAGSPAPAPPSPWPEPSPMSSPAPGSGPRLIGIRGPYVGQVFQLSDIMTVGREPDRNIQLPMDTTVSRRHARIASEGGAFVVYDEGSSNGTTVNGVRVTQQQLVSGDAVEFGSSGFRFEQ